MMIITPQLLKRYHSGRCSALEQLFVEAWLTGEEDRENEISPVLQNEQKVKDSIWDNISSFVDEDTRVTKQVNWGQYFKYIAAACLLLVLLSWPVFEISTSGRKDKSTTFVIDNLKGNSSKTAGREGLSFTLGANSKAEARTDWKSRSGSVNFCGNILITNNSDQDIEIKFNTSGRNSHNTQKTLLCQRGKTYVAIHYKFNKEEIMVFDKSELATTILPIQVYNELERI